jgi:hypothetical protein
MSTRRRRTRRRRRRRAKRIGRGSFEECVAAGRVSVTDFARLPLRPAKAPGRDHRRAARGGALTRRHRTPMGRCVLVAARFLLPCPRAGADALRIPAPVPLRPALPSTMSLARLSLRHITTPRGTPLHSRGFGGPGVEQSSTRALDRSPGGDLNRRSTVRRTRRMPRLRLHRLESRLHQTLEAHSGPRTRPKSRWRSARGRQDCCSWRDAIMEGVSVDGVAVGGCPPPATGHFDDLCAVARFRIPLGRLQ